jgi:hypothetical protein
MYCIAPSFFTSSFLSFPRAIAMVLKPILAATEKIQVKPDNAYARIVATNMLINSIQE